MLRFRLFVLALAGVGSQQGCSANGDKGDAPGSSDSGDSGSSGACGSETDSPQFIGLGDATVKTLYVPTADALLGNYSLAVADLDGSGEDKLVIGSPETSELFLLMDDTGAIGTTQDLTDAEALVGYQQRPDIQEFAFRVKNVGDVTGDGIDDVGIGSPYDLDGAGSARLLMSDTDLFTQGFEATLIALNSTTHAERLGWDFVKGGLTLDDSGNAAWLVTGLGNGAVNSTLNAYTINDDGDGLDHIQTLGINFAFGSSADNIGNISDPDYSDILIADYDNKYLAMVTSGTFIDTEGQSQVPLLIGARGASYYGLGTFVADFVGDTHKDVIAFGHSADGSKTTIDLYVDFANLYDPDTNQEVQASNVRSDSVQVAGVWGYTHSTGLYTSPCGTTYLVLGRSNHPDLGGKEAQSAVVLIDTDRITGDDGNLEEVLTTPDRVILGASVGESGENDGFGSIVEAGTDPAFLAVGAPYADIDGYSNNGAIYAFEDDPSYWAEGADAAIDQEDWLDSLEVK